MVRRRTGPDATPDIERLGEDGLLLRLGSRIDPAVNARVHAIARRLDASRPPWVRDIVPAYASLAVFVDVGHGTDMTRLLDNATAWLRVEALDADGRGDVVAARLVEIAVRYGGADGPDLEALAAHAGLDAAEVVARHAAVEYTVAMLGFAPGFPYLLGLDPSLEMARLDTPRTRVPAGSVGIGGAQTGIYPHPGPGGWRILGRTEAVLFDSRRDPPSLLCAGDRVRFVPIATP
jgi:KipI family sensor histidine kinase inhibitor